MHASNHTITHQFAPYLHHIYTPFTHYSQHSSRFQRILLLDRRNPTKKALSLTGETNTSQWPTEGPCFLTNDAARCKASFLTAATVLSKRDMERARSAFRQLNLTCKRGKARGLQSVTSWVASMSARVHTFMFVHSCVCARAFNMHSTSKRRHAKQRVGSVNYTSARTIANQQAKHKSSQQA